MQKCIMPKLFRLHLKSMSLPRNIVLYISQYTLSNNKMHTHSLRRRLQKFTAATRITVPLPINKCLIYPDPMSFIRTCLRVQSADIYVHYVQNTCSAETPMHGRDVQQFSGVELDDPPGIQTADTHLKSLQVRRAATSLS